MSAGHSFDGERGCGVHDVLPRSMLCCRPILPPWGICTSLIERVRVPSGGIMRKMLKPTTEATRGYSMYKDDYSKRLKRIEGQVRGLQRMIDEDTFCIDILTQVSAVTKALQSVAMGPARRARSALREQRGLGGCGRDGHRGDASDRAARE